MKRIKDKFKRTVKYWRVSYMQASGPERMFMGILALMVLVYMWWLTLVL